MNLKGFGRKRYLPNRVTIPKLVSMGWEWLRQISVRARPITCRNSKQVSPKCKFKGMNGLGKSTEDHKQNSWWIDGRGTSRIEIWMGRNCRIKQKPLGKNLFFVCVCVCVYLNLQCRIRCTVRILNSLHAAGLGAPYGSLIPCMLPASVHRTFVKPLKATIHSKSPSFRTVVGI